MNSSYEMLEGIGVSMAIAILRMNHAMSARSSGESV